MPGGESIAQVQERAWTALQEIMARHPGENVVLVSHSFTLQALICRLLGIPLKHFLRLKLGVASVTLLETGTDGTTLLHYNDQCHLGGLREHGHWL